MTVQRPRQRRREFFALMFALLVTFEIGRLIMPPSSGRPVVLEIIVYVLLYASLYRLFWWIGGRIGPFGG